MKRQIRQRSNWIRGKAKGSSRERRTEEAFCQRKRKYHTSCLCREITSTRDSEEEKSQMADRCSLIASPLITTAYWPTQRLAMFAWQHWLKFRQLFLFITELSLWPQLCPPLEKIVGFITTILLMKEWRYLLWSDQKANWKMIKLHTLDTMHIEASKSSCIAGACQ